MSEENEHFLVLKLKLWMPNEIMQNTDIELMRKQMKYLHVGTFTDRFRTMMPKEVLAFYQGMLRKSENEIMEILAERSKIEFDVE